MFLALLIPTENLWGAILIWPKFFKPPLESIAFIVRPVRLVAQDTALSTRRHGFDSRTGRQTLSTSYSGDCFKHFWDGNVLVTKLPKNGVQTAYRFGQECWAKMLIASGHS